MKISILEICGCVYQKQKKSSIRKIPFQNEKIQQIQLDQEQNKFIKTQGQYQFRRGNGLNVNNTIQNATINLTIYDIMFKNIEKKKIQRCYQSIMQHFEQVYSINQYITLLKSYVFNFSVDMSHFIRLGKTLRKQGYSAVYQGFVLSSCCTTSYLRIDFLVHNQLKDLVPIKSDQILMKLAQQLKLRRFQQLLQLNLNIQLIQYMGRIQINVFLGAQRAYVKFYDHMKKMRKEGLLQYQRGFWIRLITMVSAKLST
ncbi:unnamed protein product [Paramecium pentaurelia]|uniref:Uncharacterized protein n=1 Tax=Paramecium pentaurelia TaxID=43138 RepID=A0A8S1UC36_9CILI|nr:unnamed protein product [Paramecium pentaurelia]